jgi:type II restriction enzyme
MSYVDDVKAIIERIPNSLIDFNVPRVITKAPSQAASNFVTNKEQGDWAERIIFNAINETSNTLIAVKYGKSDDIIAGDAGFSDFFETFQNELDTIGKRPDLLLFRKEDYNEQFGKDISRFEEHVIHNYVKHAIAGIEIRSSAFLIDKYDTYMQNRVTECAREALAVRDLILSEYLDLLSHKSRSKYITILESITNETLNAISFKVPGWGSTDRLIELNNLFKKLKKNLQDVKKRSYLSITPKVEDLTVVNKWIQNFNVPHYYFQVFFDKVFAISFIDILTLLTDSENEGVKYFIEGDVANQNKKTIKIRARSTQVIAQKVDEPVHKSVRKELTRGQLLFYVTFENGYAYLDIDGLKSVLGINEW